MRFIQKKNKKLNICIAVVLMIIMTLAGRGLTVRADQVYSFEPGVIYYVGRVIANVNVRVDAGAGYAQVQHNGSNVQLRPGMEVIIVGQKMVGEKPWYNIVFEWEGVQLTGYSTSSYIEKTAATMTVTPTPTPSPTAAPTSTPTLTPMPTATSTPTSIPIPTGEPGTEVPEPKSDFDLFWTIVLVITLLAALAIVAIIIKNRIIAGAGSKDIKNKVQKLNNLKIEKEESEAVEITRKKRPEVRVIDEQPKEQRSVQGREVIYTPKRAEGRLPDAEEIKATASKESAEKRLLRDEIENLKQHDIVVHKYYGKGEVYDNSDIIRIEVRFGNDVRFLNKDDLVSKKLLFKYEDRYNR